MADVKDFLPLVGGAMSIFGSVARAGMDTPYAVDSSYVRALSGDYGDYGPEGVQSERRVGQVTNPYAAGAMWDEEWMRQQQQAYMDDLKARAMGQRSVSREQAADTQKTMLGMMSGERATSSRFDRPAAQMASAQQQAMLPGAMWAQTEAQALQEQQQAQDALLAYQAQQQAQNQAAFQQWSNLQDIETQRALGGGQMFQNYLGLGQSAKDWRRKAEVDTQNLYAKE